MSNVHYYQVDVNWKEGRIGELTSPDLNDTIACATPPEFNKGVPGVWSPEHLYAASINSCFMATFLAIAENMKLEFSDFSCRTTCKLEYKDGVFCISEAIIEPNIDLTNTEKDCDKGVRVLEKAKKACLITNSMKTETILKHNLAIPENVV